MIKKELQQELNRTKVVLDYARQEIKEKDKEIERLHKGIKEIIQNINSLELGSDQETYNKEGYQVDVYDIKEMLVELIGGEKE